MFDLSYRKKNKAQCQKENMCSGPSAELSTSKGSCVSGSAAFSSSSEDLVVSPPNMYGSENHIFVDTSAVPSITISSKVLFKKKPSVNATKLNTVPLIPVNATFGVVTTSPSEAMELRSTIKHERRKAKADITVVFAIRRPGCCACREHGLQLTELEKTDKSVCLVGAIKDVSVKEQGLLDFYQNYFHYPLFMDEKWEIYNTIGNRKLSIGKLFSKVPKISRRFKKEGKRIPNVMGGDHYTQGGVLIFDRRGQLRYVHYENFGEVFDIDEIRQVIKDIRAEAACSETS